MGHLHYQFDNHGNGDIISSPDRRDPESLKKIYEREKKDMNERSVKSREISDKIMSMVKSASLHGVEDAGDRYSCPILEVCAWWGKYALLGEKCFPVKLVDGQFFLDRKDSVGAEDLCQVIYRYVDDEKFSYRFL